MGFGFGCNGWPCNCPSGVDGFWLGGVNGSFSITALAQGIVFATEVCSLVGSADLSSNRYQFNGVSDSVSKAFTGGGSNAVASGAQVATADRVTFSNDTTSAVSGANLSQSRTESAGISERDTKAYFAGGDTWNGSANVPEATADLLDFSSETTSAQSSADLSVARSAVSGITEGSTKGYFQGGTTDAASTVRTDTGDLLDFSSDTTSAQTSANLSDARSEQQGVSNGSTKAFVGGGVNNTPVRVTIADKTLFSTDTTSAVTSADLSSARNAPLAQSSGSVNAFFNGGTGDVFPVATSDKLVFSTETTSANATSDLTEPKSEGACFSKTGL